MFITAFLGYHSEYRDRALTSKGEEVKESVIDEFCFINESFDEIFERLGISKEMINPKVK